MDKYPLLEINRLLTQLNLKEADPYYVQLKSPINDEQGWVFELVWAHHDGDVSLEKTEGAHLESVSQEMLCIVRLLCHAS